MVTVWMIVVAVLMVNSATTQEDLTSEVEENETYRHSVTPSLWTDVDLRPPTPQNVTSELLNYTKALGQNMVLKFTQDLTRSLGENLLDDLNTYCLWQLVWPIWNLQAYLSSTSCVEARVREMVTREAKQTIEFSLQNVSGACSSKWPTLCSTLRPECLRAHGARFTRVARDNLQDLIYLVDDADDVLRKVLEFKNKIIPGNDHLSARTPIGIAVVLSVDYGDVVEALLTNNLLVGNLTWDTIKSSAGSLNFPCSSYRDSGKYYSREVLKACYRDIYLKSDTELLLCTYPDPAVRPLTWSMAPSVFFNRVFDENAFQRYQVHLQHLTPSLLAQDRPKTFRPPTPLNNLTLELLNYTFTLVHTMMEELTQDFSSLSVPSLVATLNSRCSGQLEAPLVDLRENLSDTSCVEALLREMVTTKAERAFEVALRVTSRGGEWSLGQGLRAHEARLRTVTSDYLRDLRHEAVEEASEDLPGYVELLREHFGDVEAVSGRTPLGIVTLLSAHCGHLAEDLYYNAGFLNFLRWFISDGSVLPFTYVNMLNPWRRFPVLETREGNRSNMASSEKLTWGIVRSSAGSVSVPCAFYRASGSYPSRELLRKCYRESYLQSSVELLLSAFSERSLTWSTAPSLFVQSPCLCLAANGTDCGVEAPPGVEPSLYCLSVLLRDLQRQVSYRPALTFLDYAAWSPVPVCQFTRLLSISYGGVCQGAGDLANMRDVECVFSGIVDALRCPETLVLDADDFSRLCAARLYLEHVSCADEDDDGEVSVTYYRASNSPLVTFLACLDAALLSLTLASCLAYADLVLAGFLLTSLLRLLLVHVLDMALSVRVRVDVALDLACTLWLTACLLALGSSRRLSSPRVVLPLLCWALPAALAAALFALDDFLESHVPVGQLALLLCHLTVLVANISLFYVDLSSYSKGVARVDLLRRALKTSLLTGAGVVLRLALLLAPGTEHVLSSLHVLGSLHVLLLFLLYGCCREARDFWSSVARPCLPRQQTTTSQVLLEETLNRDALHAVRIPNKHCLLPKL